MALPAAIGFDRAIIYLAAIKACNLGLSVIVGFLLIAGSGAFYYFGSGAESGLYYPQGSALSICTNCFELQLKFIWPWESQAHS